MKRKWLGIGIILLCMSLNMPSNTRGEMISDGQSTTTRDHFDGIELNGLMGENGWYRSDVVITFNFTEEHTRIFYKLDEGNWSEYTVPLIVSTDGGHLVWGYYIDMQGNQSEIYAATFKIDQTAPEINGVFSERISDHRYRIYADVNDTTSGINRVEYYMNDCLIENSSTAPYEWIYKGPSFYLDAIVYDNAGNSKMIITPRTPIRFYAIGFINNTEFSSNQVYFFARFVLVIEFHLFTTLTNQQFMMYTSYSGFIGENFMMIRYQSFF